MKEQLMEKWKDWTKSGNKKIACIWFAKFMAFLLVCTFISRAIYAYSLARVTTENAAMMSLTHRVEAEGEIQKGMESAVNILPDIRVKEVFVSEGQMVVSGDSLFSLDLTDLQENIDAQKAEIKKKDLQIAAFNQNEKIDAVQKAIEIQRANEDYVLGMQEAGRQINDACTDLSVANAKKSDISGKDDYISDSVDHNSSVQTAEDTLDHLKSELRKLKKEVEELPDDSTSENNLKREQLEKAIEETRSEIHEAEDNLDVARDSAQYSAEEAWKQKTETANDEVRSKTKTYNDTVEKEKEDVLKNGRAVEDAAMPDKVDNTKETVQVEKEQLVKKLRQYEEVLTEGGNVTSTKGGMITKVSVSPGDPTTDHAAVLMAGESDSLRFTAEISKALQEYVAVGDSVEVSFDSGKTVLKDLNVESIEKSTTKEDTYIVTVMVPPEGLSIGKSGKLSCKKSTDNYPTCVPLNALHADGSQNYILMITESQTILGTEYKAQRRDVTISDQNDQYAALDPSAGIGEDKFILSSSKEIMSGDKVRLLEE